jgi:hypothetical protein
MTEKEKAQKIICMMCKKDIWSNRSGKYLYGDS